MPDRKLRGVQMLHMFFLLINLFCALRSVSAQGLSEEIVANPCVVQQTCSACIQANPNCAWCQQENYGENTLAPRCDYVPNLLARDCRFENIVNPESQLIYIKNESLSSEIQFYPQHISLRLRPRKPFPLEAKFKQAKDYPVDLYYLMDLSYSMLDDKAKLASLGRILAAEMRKMTSNFRLGFGSFVDKVVMPYVSTVPKKLVSPCDNCTTPYGFKHHMTLSEDDVIFKQRVEQAAISGNLDAPEGGFDAVMQAIACKDEIGWREKARKLLVLSTDASFHYAGDGKLGGIITPNDGACHLGYRDGELQYTESLTQDYPSLSQINRAVKENKITMIFAVTEDQLPTYERLKYFVEASAAGKLANDSSNVVDLVKTTYMNITSTVELKDNAPSDLVKVSYFSSCMGSGERKRTNVCSGLRVGSEVRWEIVVEVIKCPAGPPPHRIPFKIRPVGLDDELLVDLEVICGCDCEQPEYALYNSTKCSGKGTFECGICRCPPGTFGRFCECTSDSIQEENELFGCMAPNTTIVCSGRGNCVCGECVCFPRDDGHSVYGKYCECDDFDCPHFNGLPCGGPTHGHCDCKFCICKPGWTGPNCGCSTDNSTCISKNGLECNGHGHCDCGHCVCDVDPVTNTQLFYGPTCENCPTCPGMCHTLKPCAQCQAFGTGELEDEEDGSRCLKNCTLFNATHVDAVHKDMPGEEICQFRDERDFCTFFFSYYDHPDTGKLVVEVQKTKVCPEEVRALPIIIGVILGILAVGLALLLIWKILTVIHDRRQVAKFNAEVQNAKWDTSGNPIFRPATNTYRNPVYGNK
ncbi:integrin beta-PS-like [Paramacrobiotus metropolitanus]|uniref:integrin beta-PS-like n=1 Tax=Paramacrobiotus metropolitanus TaxID=2943436 RepID=UPI002445DB85|nr:integrin beta-PS-like [Paramacrobiotus metropolitanus]